MSNVLSSIKAKALERLEEELDAEKLREETERLLDKAEEALPMGSGELAAAANAVGRPALASVRGRVKEIGDLGAWGVTAFVAELASGDERAAVLLYMRESAGWDAIFDEVDRSREADAGAKRERERAKRRALATAKAIGREAAVNALPFLLRALSLGL